MVIPRKGETVIRRRIVRSPERVQSLLALALLAILAFATVAQTNLEIRTDKLPLAEVERYYSAQLLAGPNIEDVRWSAVGSLPEGMSLDPLSGILSGTPSTVGQYHVTVSVEDRQGTSVSKSFAFYVLDYTRNLEELPPTPVSSAKPPATSDIPPVDPTLGDGWVRPTDSMMMLYVPGGTFLMGSSEAEIEDQFGLRLQPDALVADLTIGQQQRLEIVKALVRGARVLILDEPTDGLDPNQKHQVRQLIQQLASGSNKIVVISTHILEEVSAVCTRAVVISRGRLLADGTPEELEARSRYHQAVTVALEQPVDSQPLLALPGVREVESQREGRLLTVIPQPGQVIFPLVGQYAREHAWPVRELSVERGRLDEVFRSLTAEEAA